MIEEEKSHSMRADSLEVELSSATSQFMEEEMKEEEENYAMENILAPSMSDLNTSMINVVLIVDDEVFNRTVLALMLKQQSVRTLQASSGFKAVACFNELIKRKEPVFKIVLLDYSMPGMDGPKTASEIFRLCEDAGVSKPTIYCVSAYQDDSYI